MYKSTYDTELRNEGNFVKKTIIWGATFLFLLGGIIWLVNRGESVVSSGFSSYHEFEEIYATCVKLDQDLGTVSQLPDTDKTFKDFSKGAILLQKKQALTRWIGEYNAKSRMWDRSMWKSASLPYQLDPKVFPNYNQTNINTGVPAR